MLCTVWTLVDEPYVRTMDERREEKEIQKVFLLVCLLDIIHDSTWRCNTFESLNEIRSSSVMSHGSCLSSRLLYPLSQTLSGSKVMQYSVFVCLSPVVDTVDLSNGSSQ